MNENLKMKKIYFITVSILLITTNLFAQKTEKSKEYANKSRPKYGLFSGVKFTTNTLVIDTFSIGLLNWYGEYLNNTDYLNKYNSGMAIETCSKEAKSIIGAERAKIIIDYLHYKYGINRKHFFVECAIISYLDSWCDHYSRIKLTFDPKKKIIQDSVSQTIHFGFKSLLIDSRDTIFLDSLGAMIIKKYPEIIHRGRLDSGEYLSINLIIHNCSEEMNSFIDVKRAKMIVEYLHNKYNINRAAFLLRWSDSYAKDCHHSAIDVVFYKWIYDYTPPSHKQKNKKSQ